MCITLQMFDLNYEGKDKSLCNKMKQAFLPIWKLNNIL